MSGSLKIAAVGDVGLVGRPAAAAVEHGTSFLLESVRPLFEGADLTVFNLEMPFAPVDAPRPAHVPESFRADPALAGSLRLPGVRVAVLANNHVMDFGRAGLVCTRRTLEKEGILTVGAGATAAEARQPLVVEVAGLRVGILAYAAKGEHTAGAARPGAAALDLPEVLEDLKALRPRVDLLTVQLHHGITYTDLPDPEGRAMAVAIARGGADLVVGHHPHVLQGLERIGKSLIAHSLGEFVFDGAIGNVVAAFADDRRRQSAILLIEASREGLVDARLVPVRLSAEGRPERPDGGEAARLLERIERLTGALAQTDEREYAARFRENAAGNLVGHETRVLLRAFARGDIAYLIAKARRVRGRHLALLLTWVRRRILSRPHRQGNTGESSP